MPLSEYTSSYLNAQLTAKILFRNDWLRRRFSRNERKTKISLWQLNQYLSISQDMGHDVGVLVKTMEFLLCSISAVPIPRDKADTRVRYATCFPMPRGRDRMIEKACRVLIIATITATIIIEYITLRPLKSLSSVSIFMIYRCRRRDPSKSLRHLRWSNN